MDVDPPGVGGPPELRSGRSADERPDGEVRAPQRPREHARDQQMRRYGLAPNLALHHQVHQLVGFRNQTLHQPKKADSHNVLNRWFARVDSFIAEFDRHVGMPP